VNNYPLIKFVVTFCIGVIISHFLPIGYLGFITVILVILVLISNLVLNYKYQFTYNVIVYFCIVTGAIIFTKLTNKPPAVYPFNETKVDVQIKAVINQITLPKENYFEFVAKTISVSSKKWCYKKQVKVLCKLKRNNNTSELNLSIGDSLIINGNLRKAREKRNPFEFDYNEYLSHKGIIGLCYIKSKNDIELIDQSSWSIANQIYEIRLSIAGLLDTLYNYQTSALLKGLLLADRSSIDYETKESFINAGVIHVLAVSGLHVGYIALIFLFLFSRFNLYFRNALTIIGLILFVLITGSPPSVVRAAIMAIVVILYMFSSRQYNKYNALALAGFIVLLLDPKQLFNPGFQLSFSAVLSIFIIYPKFQYKVESIGINSIFLKNILLFLSVSLAAQIGTLPFTIIYFNKFSVVALAANLFVIPLIGALLAIGIVSLISYPIVSIISVYYASANEVLSYILFSIVDLIGNWKYSYLYLPQFSFLDVVIFYSVLIILFLYLKSFITVFKKFIFLTLLTLNAFVFLKLDDKQFFPQNLLSVMMIDIGQGDSFLINFPNGKAALVDAGNASFGFDNGARVIKPLLKNLSIDKINYGFVSHTDADHYKGYESLLSDGIIDTIIKPPVDSTFKKDLRFDQYVKSLNIPIKPANKCIMIFGNVRLYLLTDESFFKENFHDLNEKSTVMKVVYGNTSFLFTGDAGKQVELDYANRYGEFLQSDILKAGHHGSKTSTRTEFLDLVNPKIVLISCGLNNKFKHPSPETLEIFKSRKVQFLRSDIDKAIILHSDGTTIWRNYWN
jgi:competence protein ComEC